MFGRRKRGIPKICIRAWLRMVGVFSRPLFSPPWIGREAPCMYPVLSPPSPQNGKGEWASDGALGSPSPPSPVRLFGEGPPPDGFPFSIATAGESQGGLWKTFVRQGPFPIFFLREDHRPFLPLRSVLFLFGWVLWTFFLPFVLLSKR